jgi:ATP-dependent Lon protease
VRRTVSGLMKLLHPHGQVSQADLEELLRLAIEGRRRVKEQLKKMGAFEYHQTAFSYRSTTPAKNALSAFPNRAAAT